MINYTSNTQKLMIATINVILLCSFNLNEVLSFVPISNINRYRSYSTTSTPESITSSSSLNVLFEKEPKHNTNDDNTLPPLPIIGDSFDEGDEIQSLSGGRTLHNFVAPWDEMDDFDVPNQGQSPKKEEFDTTVMDQITKQRQQIQELMLLVQNQAKNISEIKHQGNMGIPSNEDRSSFSSGTPKRTLKAMLFIDGTWLYYSLHHRGDRCPIVANYGLGWQHAYKINWGELPKLIAKELQLQLSNKGWHSSELNIPSSGPGTFSNQQHAVVEITRATCFTSYKASTDKNSLRVKMFNQMEAAGFDMIKMETVGKGEKCVDIALAVDMLHYATIPGSMDICILLTGDKDFIPACLRVRQKGVQLAVVSMRQGCNRALDTTPQMKDFDIIFLDPLLTNVVVPQDTTIQHDQISAVDIIKAIYGFILGPHGEEYQDNDGVLFRRAESRELGRFLKSFRQNRTNFLNEIKTVHGGLRHFASAYPKFFTITNSNEMAFWVGINLESSSIDDIEEELKKQDSRIKILTTENEDFHEKTVVELKEMLRSYNLPVSGKKADLIERLKTFHSEQQLNDKHDSLHLVNVADRSSLDQKVISIIQDYLKACGGSTGSRDVGRYLSANSVGDRSALSFVKENHGSLASFLLNRATDYFVCTGVDDPTLYKKDGFTIATK